LTGECCSTETTDTQ
jgi:hypothetical protein